jgi:hypothetical protein
MIIGNQTESDSENAEHGDELTGCYKGIPVNEHGDPISAEHKLTEEEQVTALRWQAQQSKWFTGSTIRAIVPFAAGFIV